MRLTLTEVPAPVPAVADAAARDRVWDAARERNPALFDGPLVLVTEQDDTGDGLRISWARATYRSHSLFRGESRVWWPCLFVVTVQPTTDGRLVVGRMSGSTVVPGRSQLPGGTVEPPPPGGFLTAESLRAHASRELREELGVVEDRLELRGTVHVDGNLGLAYVAPPLEAAEVLARHAELCRSEEQPEFSEVVAVDTTAGLEPRASYLDNVVQRFLG